MNKNLETIYLDWVNNFLTVEGFASHYNMNERDAKELIAILQRNNLNTTYDKGQA